MALLAAPFLLFRRSQANVLLAIVLAVQLVDTIPLFKWAHSRVVPSEIEGFWKPAKLQPLQSPIWYTLGSVHENLVVLPAWQCGSGATPGGLDGYRIFGFLAAAQKMRTNSYRSSRYTVLNSDFHCKQAIAALAEQPLSPDVRLRSYADTGVSNRERAFRTGEVPRAGWLYSVLPVQDCSLGLRGLEFPFREQLK